MPSAESASAFSLTASQAFTMKPNLRDALVNHTVIISSSKTFHQISTHHFPLPPCLSFWIFLSYPLMLGLQRVQQTSQQESSENPPCAKYFQHSRGCLGYTLAKEPCHLQLSGDVNMIPVPNQITTAWPVQKDRAQREPKKTAVGLSRAAFASVALSL